MTSTTPRHETQTEEQPITVLPAAGKGFLVRGAFGAARPLRVRLRDEPAETVPMLPADVPIDVDRAPLRDLPDVLHEDLGVAGREERISRQVAICERATARLLRARRIHERARDINRREAETLRQLVHRETLQHDA